METPSCFSLCLIAAILAMTSCYPTGAPEEACATLDPTPSHGASTATGPPPYKLTMSSTTYKPKQNITVTLSGLGSVQYKGFLVEGRQAVGTNTDSVGYFYNTTTTKNVCLSSKVGTGITHINSDPKSSETFTWRAPDTSMGNIYFIYTVVRGNGDHASDFFKGIKSPPLTPSGSPSVQMTIN